MTKLMAFGTYYSCIQPLRIGIYMRFFIFLVTSTFIIVRMATVGLEIALVAKVYILMGRDRNICCFYCPHKRDLICAGNECLYI